MNVRNRGFALRFAHLVALFCWSVLGHAASLSVPQRYQEMDQWCWAGVSQSLLEYYGTNVTQTQIAAYGSEGANIWNWLWGASSNPTRRGVDMILANFGSLATSWYSQYLSLSESQGEIDANRPFVVRWAWDSGGGHFVVVKGVRDSMMELMDPADGPTINAYSWVVSGSSHTWTHTLTMNTAPTTATHTLDVNSTGATGVAIAASPSAYAGMTNYSITGIAANTSIMLTAPAMASDGNFGGWSGCDSNLGYTCTINVNANRAATVNYEPIQIIGLPAAPSIVSIAAAGRRLTIHFNPPSSNGGAAITSYTASCTSGDVPRTASGAGSPLTVTGLTNGESYACTVAATNSAGTGSASNEVVKVVRPSIAPILNILLD